MGLRLRIIEYLLHKGLKVFGHDESSLSSFWIQALRLSRQHHAPSHQTATCVQNDGYTGRDLRYNKQIINTWIFKNIIIIIILRVMTLKITYYYWLQKSKKGIFGSTTKLVPEEGKYSSAWSLKSVYTYLTVLWL